MKSIVEIVKMFREIELKLNPKKFGLFQKEVQCLGHVILTEGVKKDSKKSIAVKNWTTGTKKLYEIVLCCSRVF